MWCRAITMHSHENILAHFDFRDPSLLTPRELQVLRLIEAGHSNQEIADQLFISLFTVKSHVQRLSGKLNVKRRTQAVSKARLLGLI
ncbi:TPA: response regulator transcription factor [Pseudomonas aeruginosa]|nr:response regulator transcription factor [Pseudomonas aeruginosa]HBO3119414.1 response regulator transcription factor [Pseudomonas aeruginosa]